VLLANLLAALNFANVFLNKNVWKIKKNVKKLFKNVFTSTLTSNVYERRGMLPHCPLMPTIHRAK